MKLLAFRALCVCVLAFCLPATFTAGVQWDPDGSVHPANRLNPHFRSLNVTSNTALSVLTVTNTITAGGLVVAAPTFSSFANAPHNHQDAAGGAQLNASSVFSAGTIPTARLGSGVADSTTFLRGDSTWQVPAGAGSSIFFDGVSVSNPDFDSNTNVVWQINGTNVTAYVTNVTSGQILGGTGFGNVVRAGSPTISDPIFTSTIFFEGLVFTIEGAIADGNETLFEFGEPSGDATYEFDTTRMSTPGAIDVGHISDTTLERAASGFLSVEGKRVASPDSAVAGDIMFFDGTEWVRLAKGLAGQVLEMNAGATAPEWDTDDSGGSQTPWTSNIDGDNFSLLDVFQITSSNLLSGRRFHTGTSVSIPWVMDEHEIHLSADTTFELSSVPTDTNYVSGPRIWVVGDGASVFTNSANSILWHPTYPGVVPSGTNEVLFTIDGGIIHGYLGWKTVSTNGLVAQNDDGHYGIAFTGDPNDVLLGDGTFGPGGSSPTTTRGDLIYRGATEDERLPVGSIWKVLGSDGTDPAWGDNGWFGLMSRNRPVWVSANGSTAVQSFGVAISTSGTGSTGAPSANGPQHVNIITTAATTGTDLGIGTSSVQNWFGRTLRYMAVIRVEETNAVRYWFGLHSVAASTMAGSDDPAAHIAAFRYSTDASDTTWRPVTKDGTTINALAGSTVASTSLVRLGIDYTPSVSAKFYVNGTLVGTSTNNLPGTTTTAFWGAYGETRENVNKNIEIYHVLVEEAFP